MFAIMAFLFLVLLLGLAFWRLHPVIFMLAAAYSYVMACYMPEVINGGVTDNVSMTAILIMIGLTITLIGFAYYRMFIREKVDGRN